MVVFIWQLSAKMSLSTVSHRQKSQNKRAVKKPKKVPKGNIFCEKNFINEKWRCGHSTCTTAVLWSVGCDQFTVTSYLEREFYTSANLFRKEDVFR